MDPITAMHFSIWELLKPYMPFIAHPSKQDKNIPESVNKIWQKVQERLSEYPSSNEALKDLLNNAYDEDAQSAFRLQLRKVLEKDDRFKDEVKNLLEEAKDSYKTNIQVDGAIAHGNAISVGKINIGGNIGGNIVIDRSSSKNSK